jgi:hypothetical protein
MRAGAQPRTSSSLYTSGGEPESRERIHRKGEDDGRSAFFSPAVHVSRGGRDRGAILDVCGFSVVETQMRPDKRHAFPSAEMSAGACRQESCSGYCFAATMVNVLLNPPPTLGQGRGPAKPRRGRTAGAGRRCRHAQALPDKVAEPVAQGRAWRTRGPAFWIKVPAQTGGTFSATNTRNNFTKTYAARK